MKMVNPMMNKAPSENAMTKAARISKGELEKIISIPSKFI